MSDLGHMAHAEVAQLVSKNSTAATVLWSAYDFFNFAPDGGAYLLKNGNATSGFDTSLYSLHTSNGAATLIGTSGTFLNHDFLDFNPVPFPPAMLLFLSGVLALYGLRRNETT